MSLYQNLGKMGTIRLVNEQQQFDGKNGTMVDGENWKLALEADGEDGALTILSNRLWSAAMRAFESTATVGVVRQANSSPVSPIAPESFLV